jgi:NADH:quinone reductase (non-electrogenic)
VEVLLDTEIEQIDRDGVIAGGQRIRARTVIWGAGVKARGVADWLGVKAGKHGAVEVNPDFTVPGHPNVFVIGDAAEFNGADGRPLPGLAAVAKQEGQYVGLLLRELLQGRHHRGPFRYRDYGLIATIGRSAAVADIRGFKFTGWLAWLLWGVVHLYFLISFRNRVVVLINWLWAWLTYAHGARVIMAQPAPHAARARGSARGSDTPHP